MRVGFLVRGKKSLKLAKGNEGKKRDKGNYYIPKIVFEAELALRRAVFGPMQAFVKISDGQEKLRFHPIVKKCREVGKK